MENKFYIYAHKRRTDGRVFYVGKGCGKRIHQTGNRNVYWKNIAKKHGYEASILEERLEEIESYKKEIYWIAFYKAKGQCEANVTLGGDGVMVEKRWWYDKVSKALRGKVRARGKASHSYKEFADKDQLARDYLILDSISIGKKYGVSYGTVCERLKEFGLQVRNPGRRKIRIICTNDGKKYNSINEAAIAYGVFRENIRKVLYGKYKHTGGKHFDYCSKE